MQTFTAILDSKGRLVVPKQMRERDALEYGDLFVVDPDSAAGTITFVRVENPLIRIVAESRSETATLTRGSQDSSCADCVESRTACRT
jgi:bifunctional DNA-binding transcriptional regulator/antitoxin component of YhaV-PrlF toxin-antitoxin module